MAAMGAPGSVYCSPQMKSARSPLLLCLSFAACGTVTAWRELRTAPMTFGEGFDGIEFIASRDGFGRDTLHSDRALGYWQSRGRSREPGLGRPGRYRLRIEVMIDEGSVEAGWPVRYAIYQEKVKDLAHSRQPREEDWSQDGQDRERETILGEKLVRRLAPKTVTPPGAAGPGS